MSKRIIELSNIEAKKFFLKNKSYFSLNLPEYFNFEKLLEAISSDFTGDYTNIKKSDPKYLEKVNYIFFNNKDGKYDWRPFEIINPTLYISLLNGMFSEENWRIITERMKDIEEKSDIICESLPRVDIKEETVNYKDGTQITNWWNKIEQTSLELAIEYEYIFHTDIVDCYNSIYTHSIAWAIHTREVAKVERSKSQMIGNIIDRHLQAMSYGQTNGIPQGSVLMDFIAEIVLFYSDELISNKIKEKGIDKSKFKILRYRDDYRIFTNSNLLGNEILKIISEELSSLGMKLHTTKTKYSNNIIQSSIKEDKINSFMLARNNNLQKRMLLLHKFSFENKNSGSLTKELGNIKKIIDKKKNLKKENIKVLISIVTDIAYYNSKTFVEISSILSTLLSKIEDREEKKLMVEKVFKKLKKVPNSGYFEIWFQRVLLKETLSEFDIEFEENLCKIVKDSKVKLWNNDWISNMKILANIKNISIIDEERKEELPEMIQYKEIKVFDEHY